MSKVRPLGSSQRHHDTPNASQIKQTSNVPSNGFLLAAMKQHAPVRDNTSSKVTHDNPKHGFLQQDAINLNHHLIN
jgi:hypothetical protein